MTIPLWAPFAALSVLCLIFPRPARLRRIDWFVLGFWTAAMAFCVGVWIAVATLVGRAV